MLRSIALMLFAAVSLSAADDPLDLVKQGRKLNSEGRHQEALALYNKALAQSPDLYEAHLEAGIALDLNGDYPAAQRHFSKAIELAKPDARPQALRSMAFSYAFQRDAKNAIVYEKQVFDSRIAAANFTAAAETANELARLCLASGDLDDASQWYKTGYDTALRKTGSTPAERDLWNFRWESAQARIAAHRGNRADAEKHIAAAKGFLDKGTNPDQERFFPYLTGYVAFYLNDYPRAIADLQKADQRDPLILALLGEAYRKSGDSRQAADYYRKTLAINIHNPTNAFARPVAAKNSR